MRKGRVLNVIYEAKFRVPYNEVKSSVTYEVKVKCHILRLSQVLHVEAKSNVTY